MADEMRTCPNCGNTQAAGDFCEKCGTRMTDAAAEETSAPAQGTAAAPGAGPQTPPAPGTYQPGAYQPGGYQQGAYQPGGPPPYGYGPQQQYVPPREPGPWNKLFDFSFQGFGITFGRDITKDLIAFLNRIRIDLIGQLFGFGTGTIGIRKGMYIIYFTDLSCFCRMIEIIIGFTGKADYYIGTDY